MGIIQFLGSVAEKADDRILRIYAPFYGLADYRIDVLKGFPVVPCDRCGAHSVPVLPKTTGLIRTKYSDKEITDVILCAFPNAIANMLRSKDIDRSEIGEHLKKAYEYGSIITLSEAKNSAVVPHTELSIRNVLAPIRESKDPKYEVNWGCLLTDSPMDHYLN